MKRQFRIRKRGSQGDPHDPAGPIPDRIPQGPAQVSPSARDELLDPMGRGEGDSHYFPPLIHVASGFEADELIAQSGYPRQEICPGRPAQRSLILLTAPPAVRPNPDNPVDATGAEPD